MRILAAGALLVSIAGPVLAEEPLPRPGEKVRPFAVKDIRFVSRSLADFPRAKAFAIVFTGTACPVANAYLPRLEAMGKELRGRGVVFLGVNANPAESMVETAAQALERSVTFPVHKDFDQSALAALGVRRTPEAVVLDREGVLRYRGRIDDRHRVSGAASGPGREWLREALEAVLSGKAPEVAETAVEGCLIDRLRPVARPEVTWTEAGPVIVRRCGSCHRSGQAAPFPLLDYRDAAARVEMVAEVVRERRMPPAFADPRHGDFVNHRPLDREEMEMVLAWVENGAPRGDAARVPGVEAGEPVPSPEGWVIGAPDLILEAPEHRIPATGTVRYRYHTFDHVFEHDVWVRAIQILPANRRVVHHANLYLEPPRGAPLGFPLFVTGYVPGGDATRYGPGTGILIRAGHRLRLQIHHVTTGRPETDRLRLGLSWPRGRIERHQKCLTIINNTFAIPPGDPAHEVRSRGGFTASAIGTGLFIHMHVRGKDMTFQARYPDGASETLLSVPAYSFDWQLAYGWAEGARRFPAGTVVETVSHYDNSPWNPFNPDPAATVREGQQTHQEMNYGFLFYVDEEERLGIEVDPRTGRPVSRASSVERRARF